MLGGPTASWSISSNQIRCDVPEARNDQSCIRLQRKGHACLCKQTLGSARMTVCLLTSNAHELHQLELWKELPLLHCLPKLAIRLWLQHGKQDGQLLECPSICTPFSQSAQHQLHDYLVATKVHGDAGHSTQILKAVAKLHAKCRCHEPHALKETVSHVQLVLEEASGDVHLSSTLMSTRRHRAPPLQVQQGQL